jgi:hypothetical protein
VHYCSLRRPDCAAADLSVTRDQPYPPSGQEALRANFYLVRRVFEVVDMRRLIAIGTNDRNIYFVVRFSDIPECMAFVESLDAVRMAIAQSRANRNEATSWTSEVIPGPSTFNIGSRAGNSRANSRRRRQRFIRLAFRPT